MTFCCYYLIKYSGIWYRFILIILIMILELRRVQYLLIVCYRRFPYRKTGIAGKLSGIVCFVGEMLWGAGQDPNSGEKPSNSRNDSSVQLSFKLRGVK